MITIIFLLFILAPIICGVILIIKSKKILGFLCLSVPTLIFLFIASWWVYEVNHHFVKSTSLKNEQMDQLTLYEPLTSQVKERFGSYNEMDNVFYEETLSFKRLLIGTNENTKIIFISTRDPKVQTTKNINVNDSLEKVISQYGESYYIYRDMGMDHSINYVDRESSVHMQFYYRDDKITEIVLQVM